MKGLVLLREPAGEQSSPVIQEKAGKMPWMKRDEIVEKIQGCASWALLLPHLPEQDLTSHWCSPTPMALCWCPAGQHARGGGI